MYSLESCAFRSNGFLEIRYGEEEHEEGSEF
jgi:hypothetical protein